MASLISQHLLTTTTNGLPPSSFGLYSHKNTQISRVNNRKNHLVPRVSSKATNGDQNHASGSKDGQPPLGKFDRRDMLLGLGGLCGATSVFSDQVGLAEPVEPDVGNCGEIKNPDKKECCPPPFTHIKDFVLPSSEEPFRLRRAAHLASQDYIEKYCRAIELMKALPDNDPRNFTQQANVHCAYCDGAYPQVGHPKIFQVHGSWLFFPFHRYYLYFYERILGKLIDDPNFALPFWNWDSPDGMTIPEMYTYQTCSLYDPYRNSAHQPPVLIDLEYSGTDEPTPDHQVQLNLATMYRQMVSNSKKPYLFFGKSYCAGDNPTSCGGSIEHTPHNTVHDWCGDPRREHREDMGIFHMAARDPIFFAHHSNVDRMWNIRKEKQRLPDITDPDWLHAEFYFYDENKDLVRVKVKDCLDTKKLRYGYQDVDIQWMNSNSKPTPRKLKLKKFAPEPPATDKPPFYLNQVSRTLVHRSKNKKKEQEEVLEINGIQCVDERLKFDVYINENDPSKSGPGKTEFAGSFVRIPHKHSHGEVNVCLQIGISELLKDLCAEEDESVLVTLNRRYGESKVQIQEIKIELFSEPEI